MCLVKSWTPGLLSTHFASGTAIATRIGIYHLAAIQLWLQMIAMPFTSFVNLRALRGWAFYLADLNSENAAP